MPFDREFAQMKRARDLLILPALCQKTKHVDFAGGQTIRRGRRNRTLQLLQQSSRALHFKICAHSLEGLFGDLRFSHRSLHIALRGQSVRQIDPDSRSIE